MIVSDILGRVRPVLNDSDATAYRWSNADLISYINDACRLVLINRPDANTLPQSLTLVAGAIQSIPDTAYKLIDVTCNLSSGAQGRAITLIESSILDAHNPSWRSGSKQSSVKHYMYDPRTPRRFEVYPPVSAGATIQAKVAAYTTNATQTSDAISLADEYMEPVVVFVLHKAYARDMEFAGNADLAAFYLGQFNSMLGLKTGKDVAFSPQTNRKGDVPAPAAQIGGV